MRVIGLISGTSVDGIDAALVELSGTTHDLQAQLIAAQTYPYPADLRDRIQSEVSLTKEAPSDLHNTAQEHRTRRLELQTPRRHQRTCHSRLRHRPNLIKAHQSLHATNQAP